MKTRNSAFYREICILRILVKMGYIDKKALPHIIDIAAKILDYVCCDFHNHTKFDFIKDDCDMFTEFREAYLGTNIKSCD